jgi:hypothetical protein
MAFDPTFAFVGVCVALNSTLFLLLLIFINLINPIQEILMNWANTNPWIYQRWGQVHRRSKHFRRPVTLVMGLI